MHPLLYTVLLSVEWVLGWGAVLYLAPFGRKGTVSEAPFIASYAF